MRIGLLGRARHGKDTVGTFLRDKYGYKPLAFAKPLKDFARGLFNFTDEQLYGNDRDVIDKRALNPDFWRELLVNRDDCDYQVIMLFNGLNVPSYMILQQLDSVLDYLESNKEKFSARIALQHLGTEFGRALHPNVWTNAAMQEAAKYRKVVITDCRFVNEAIALNGEIWWIDSSKRLADLNVNPHPSEPKKEDFIKLITKEIDNNGTILELYQSLANLPL